MNRSIKTLQERSYLDGDNAAYLEALYESYLANPAEVSVEWGRCFDSFLPKFLAEEPLHSVIRGSFSKPWLQGSPKITGEAQDPSKQLAIDRLIETYSREGHRFAHLDPLGLAEPQTPPSLPSTLGISPSEYELIKNLQEIYCGSIGFEYTHISNKTEREWLRARIESKKEPILTPEEKKRILECITAAEGLEKYLHTKYVGQKRFSLEGADSLIPLLYDLIQRSGAQRVKDIVIGMAHRGRLNVLVNTLGKSPQIVFKEFEEHQMHRSASEGSGDVKYHLGFCSDIETPGEQVHVALGFNPSHLEIVSPVVLGAVKARQERRSKDTLVKNTKNEVMSILIHGDASFAGQGVVMETINMSLARGFTVGGTLHIIVNNQIGFTTSIPQDARSTFYCSDLAKMADIPIFHVNGDDPESVLFAARTALDYRLRFNKDVVMDLVCYRRHGHNEADEPAATQPFMYKTIARLPTLRALYTEKLVKEAAVTREVAEEMVRTYRTKLTSAEKAELTPITAPTTRRLFAQDWKAYSRQTDLESTLSVETKLDGRLLKMLAGKLLELPREFILHPRVQKIMQDRARMMKGEIPMDWGYAENLAYATLINEGFAVRLCGQDTGRGTFFHRHAVLHDQKTDKTYIPLQHLSEKQAAVSVVDSLLSEEAVLAYEYGYASTNPKVLVVWEAQFGDFANGAQVVIDQFISSGEQKWGRLCGLVLFLPHGYEGQGPEHSSARLERYLQLCAEHNMLVCVPSTPAQIFHLLRRQMHAATRKPLIVMTPKSLLRHKLATSILDELAEGYFKLLIPEIDALDPKTIKRIVLCSGKVYYELLEARRKMQKTDIALLRIEQLYPFPENLLASELERYVKVKDIVWCQEEPMNQGAWYCSQHHMRASLQSGQTLRFVGRGSSASPATGHYATHLEQQECLVKEALGI